jgi:hypothetical protein
MALCAIVQLHQLSEIDAGLRAEHMLRRHMLTERVKVGCLYMCAASLLLLIFNSAACWLSQITVVGVL